MLNMKNYGVSSKLTKPIGATDTTIVVTPRDGLKFEVPEGDYFYATIKSNGLREFVKVVKTTGDNLLVVRGQDNSVAQSFPRDACIVVEWNPQQLCLFVHACVDGDIVSGLSGVHCIDCGTCITLDSGKITKIDGEQKC